MFKKVGNKIESYNPATKELLGSVDITPSAEITLIVSRCIDAFKVWSCYSYKERGDALKELANNLETKSKYLSELMTSEMGRPLSESLPEVTKSIKFIRTFADKAEQMLSDYLITEVPGKNVKITSEPYGVVALIKPWNMPLQTPIWSIAPALMAGNAIAFKPSENSLLVARELEKTIQECKVFPVGLVGFIYGDAEQGKELLDNDINMVSFTGSVGAGKAIAKQVADRFIKTSLELGGKDPMIVLPDADIKFAAMAAVWGSTTNCGQFCSSIERVYVHESIFDNFVQIAKSYCEKIKVGNGLDPAIEMGPVVNEQQFNKVISQIEEAKQCGATIVTGGCAYASGELANGWFIQPTLITNLTQEMSIMREETFGPVVRIMKYSTIDEAIALANDSEYGLGSSVITQDIQMAQYIANRIDTGMVWINEPLLSNEYCPWIARKNSGLGYELGELGIREFVKLKIISSQFENNDTHRTWWYPY